MSRQALMKNFKESSDGHKSILPILNKLVIQTESLSEKVGALDAVIFDKKNQQAHILKLQNSLDALKLRESQLCSTIEKLEVKLVQAIHDKEKSLELQQRDNAKMKSLGTTLDEMSLSNANLTRANVILMKRLNEAEVGLHEISLCLEDATNRISRICQEEKICIKASRLLEQRLAQALRREDALQKLQTASDSESLQLYKQIQGLVDENKSLLSTAHNADENIISLDAELSALRMEMSDVQQQCNAAHLRYFDTSPLNRLYFPSNALFS